MGLKNGGIFTPGPGENQRPR